MKIWHSCQWNSSSFYTNLSSLSITKLDKINWNKPNWTTWDEITEVDQREWIELGHIGLNGSKQTEVEWMRNTKLMWLNKNVTIIKTTIQLLDIYIYIYNDKLVVPISLKRASFFLLFLHILSSIPSRTLKLIS